MIPNPILKVLSTLTSHQVRHLLMGGQACVLYGAAEFSRDTDIAVLAQTDNLERLCKALDELQATCIAVPPFRQEYLLRGHAVHFRCSYPEVAGLRIDVMSVFRGMAPFQELWQRRTTLEMVGGICLEVMGLPDLVVAKKTQRAKDWPMIKRLIEANYASNKHSPTADQVRFWLQESRTDAMLIDLAEYHPDLATEISRARPLVALATTGNELALAEALEQEELQEREADRAYWKPLRAELETIRHRKG